MANDFLERVTEDRGIGPFVFQCGFKCFLWVQKLRKFFNENHEFSCALIFLYTKRIAGGILFNS